MRLVFLAALPLLAGALAGCSDRACFQWTAAEGACPSQSEALPFMTPPFCGGDVVSVDGAGELTDNACCYPVTLSSRDGLEAPCATPPTGPSGPGGPGVTASVSVTSSSGVGGGSSECQAFGGDCAPACDAPAVSPSFGACVVVDGVSVVCNPVTNEGCNANLGEACDIDPGAMTPFCYPAPNFEPICESCGDNGAGFCNAGLHCFGSCFRFCCESTDCGTGICFKDPFSTTLLPTLGVCIDDGTAGAGGAGGMGGAGVGGAGGMGVTGGVGGAGG